MITVTCENCGTVFDGLNAAACYLHQHECIPNDDPPKGQVRIRAQKIGLRWSAVVYRGDRSIYLTDDCASREIALAAAADFLALLD